MNEVHYLCVDLLASIICNGQYWLNSAHNSIAEILIYYLAQYLFPITLIFLTQNIWNTKVETITIGCFSDWILYRPKMPLNLIYNLGKYVLVEVDYPFKV